MTPPPPGPDGTDAAVSAPCSFESPPPSPWPLLAAWHAEAEACPTIRYAHAVTLATSDENGADARVVLVHRMDAFGLLISSDSASAKAEQLKACPKAALVFHWGPLERQVRIRGTVIRSTDGDADFCFAERPRQSRITAWSSRQGQPLPTALEKARRELESAWQASESGFEGLEEVPRPEYWQAFRVLPWRIELWQARARRLHDRLVYERREPWPNPPAEGDSEVDSELWQLRRLAP